MKALFTVLFFCGIFSLNAQKATEPIETVKEFFKAFHQKDTAKMRKMAYKSVIMQSISTESSGITELTTTKYDDFLKTIASIPAEATFEERVTGYKSQSDALMAQVWAPYEFYYDGKMSHNGTNNFQLLKENGLWKIFYIVDTRIEKRKERKEKSEK
jgi:limonene-1,2-epoxide hydrolase